MNFYLVSSTAVFRIVKCQCGKSSVTLIFVFGSHLLTKKCFTFTILIILKESRKSISFAFSLEMNIHDHTKEK